MQEGKPAAPGRPLPPPTPHHTAQPPRRGRRHPRPGLCPERRAGDAVPCGDPATPAPPLRGMATATVTPLSPVPPLGRTAPSVYLPREPMRARRCPAGPSPAEQETPLPAERRRGVAQDGGGRAVCVWADQVPGVLAARPAAEREGRDPAPPRPLAKPRPRSPVTPEPSRASTYPPRRACPGSGGRLAWRGGAGPCPASSRSAAVSEGLMCFCPSSSRKEKCFLIRRVSRTRGSLWAAP